MKRYENSKIETRWDGKRVYKSVTYPEIIASDKDLIIISKEGDFLDTLAYKYYKDPTLYWIIACANNLGKGRMSIIEGSILRIPSDINNIIATFKRINS